MQPCPPPAHFPPPPRPLPVRIEARVAASWRPPDGKGLDLALDVHFLENRDKDYRLHVQRYARHGITEYFLFDAAELRLFGYRLAPDGRTHKPILSQGGLTARHRVDPERVATLERELAEARAEIERLKGGR